MIYDTTTQSKEDTMERQFTLDIALGNVSMSSHWDVTEALRKVADRIDNDDFHPGHTSSIMDGNGARVGSFKFSAGSLS